MGQCSKPGRAPIFSEHFFDDLEDGFIIILVQRLEIEKRWSKCR
jgi:hypothetical protein